MKPPHGSSTETGSETGRASPSRPSACAARAGRTACSATASARGHGFAIKASRQPRKWPINSTSRPGPSALSAETEMNPAWSEQSSPQKADDIACSGRTATTTWSPGQWGRTARSRNPHAKLHRQNKVHHETRDLSRGFLTAREDEPEKQARIVWEIACSPPHAGIDPRLPVSGQTTVGAPRLRGDKRLKSLVPDGIHIQSDPVGDVPASGAARSCIYRADPNGRKIWP